ncbi:MAG: alpha/beta hydrolase [Symploca sp. SIO2E6]|nr:alpha/beta hydrolase [Symploca sp. SIO2E6]
MDLPLRNSRIKLPSGQIFWREVGQGPILVFLHGSWSDSSQWLSVIEHLNQDYHCFALDLLGFGESEQPQKIHYSIQLEVECLFKYLEALRLQPVYLIGHSLGGWIAASYVLQYWEQVHGLVLIAPEGVLLEGQQSSWRWSRWLVGRLPIAYGVLRSLLPLAKILRRDKLIEEILQKRRQLLSSPTACKLLFQRRWSEIQAELLQERLDSLQLPTLILQGKKDHSEAISRSQIYASHSPKAQLQMISHGGSNLPEYLPALVARYITEFVSNCH